MVEFIVPVKTVNESNGSHGHWQIKANRRKAQRRAVWAAIGAVRTDQWRFPNGLPALPVRVTLTRISAGELDEHDNLRGALKAIADEVAEAYGVPDKDKRFSWAYGQERCKRGEFGVRIRIEPADFA